MMRVYNFTSVLCPSVALVAILESVAELPVIAFGCLLIVTFPGQLPLDEVDGMGRLISWQLSNVDSSFEVVRDTGYLHFLNSVLNEARRVLKPVLFHFLVIGWVAFIANPRGDAAVVVGHRPVERRAMESLLVWNLSLQTGEVLSFRFRGDLHHCANWAWNRELSNMHVRGCCYLSLFRSIVDYLFEAGQVLSSFGEKSKSVEIENSFI